MDTGKKVMKSCEVMGGEKMKEDENENLITGQRYGGNLGKRVKFLEIEF